MRFANLLLLLYSCACGLLHAQDCAPDPRPALFSEDFGRGSNPGSALPEGTTSYTYGDVNTGHYVVSNTSNLITNFWHDGRDHTEDDTDGYMLIFNAAGGPNLFYQKTFADLCPNTDYIFSCYIANVVVPTGCIGYAFKPDIRFSVYDLADENVALATNTTGEIFYSSFLDWREYTLQFRTGPEQTGALIELTNNAQSGCGSDFALDDISLRTCNPARAQSFDLCDLPEGFITVGGNTHTEPGVYVDAVPAPNSCNDTIVTTTLTGTTRYLPPLEYTFCAGDSLVLDNQVFTTSTSFVDTLAGPTPDCSRFQPYEIVAQSQLATTQSFTLCNGEGIQVGTAWYTATGTYADTLSSAAGCDSIVLTTITAGAIEVMIDPSSVDIEKGESVALLASVLGTDSYTLEWLPPEGLSCTDCPDPLLQVEASTVYELRAIDSASGCTDDATLDVKVRSCQNVFVPNVFSPNNDDINDRLSVFAEPCFTTVVSWRIFDRWGGLVYETENQLFSESFEGWDGWVNGEAAEQGAYGYQLVVERENGMREALRGEVLLLR